MKNLITIGGKFGYLMPKTGRYSWAEIISIDTNKKTFKMRQEIPQGKYSKFVNNYEEEMEKIIPFLKTFSEDFPNKYLVKYKGTKKLY